MKNATLSNIQIQHNGAGLAVVITGTRAQRNATLASLYNHEALQETEPHKLPGGEWVVTVSKYRFLKGLANRLEFLSGIDFSEWGTAKQAREMFERRAADMLASFPRTYNAIVRVNPFA